jgi:two-component system response regulator ResD
VFILKKLLLIDDDFKICDITKQYLTKAGYEVVVAYDGNEARAALSNQQFCFVIFDAMLPDESGFDLLHNFREGMYVLNSNSSDKDTPAIMMTALGQTSNVLKGLRGGADDYVTKPFDPNELVERVNVILKRAGKFIMNSFEIGNIVINLTTQIISCEGNPLDLKRREFDLLTYLCKNSNHVFSREDLINAVWGWDYEGGDRAVDICIKRVREKLQKASAQIEIKTIWGVGYRLEEKK